MVDRMECSGVYIDDRVRSERWVRRTSIDATSTVSSIGSLTLAEEPEALQTDVEQMLGVCKKIYLCSSGGSFATKLAELSDRSGSDCTPIFAFFGIDFKSDDTNVARRKASRASWTDGGPPSPGSIQRTFTFSAHQDEAPGLSLLSGVSTDIQVQGGPKLVIPIAILRVTGSDAPEPTSEPQSKHPITLEHKQIARCLDAGAVDVLMAPLDRSRIQGLVVHAYRYHRSAQREMSRFLAHKKNRKLSWVGVHDEQPYAYLREAMVSKLMKGICNPEEVIEEFQEREIHVELDREPFVKQQVGSWSFSAHDFTEDELVFAACEIIQHAFNLPGLEHWRLTPGELQTFLLACRAAYNNFVLYHNFRHAIDVLQSVFCFLLRIGALPPYEPSGIIPTPKAPIASLIAPFDALTLLISAIGHDVGHPGVNNFFLVKLNAPLAQLYNDNSVLEAFHCAAFSQILRRHWPSAFKDNQLRKLLISSILATDMGVHQKFMQRMGTLQEKYHENHKSVEGWKPQDIELYKTLLCGLLIKCADISNVARPWPIAEKWTQILQEEFANQGEMEKEVGMETALFGGPPELGNIYKLATGQIGFMSIFALPLFEGVSDLLPQLQFTADHINRNQAQWQQHANDELRKQGLQVEERAESTVSPRSQSPHGKAGDEDSTPKAALRPVDGAQDVPSPGSESSTESPAGAYNENTIEPVVSPDTPGPQIEITGTPLAPEVPSRKSSSAVPGAMPDLSYFSIPGAPRTGRGSVGTPGADSVHSPGEPAVLAAAHYANSANAGTAGNSMTVAEQEAIPEAIPERPSSSRQGPSGPHRHHAHHSSSVRTSAPSGSNRNSCTRTRSISAYSNNMTPISPATNATSFLAVDSGDEKRVSDDSAPQSELGDNSTRPSTSYASNADQESTYSRGIHSSGVDAAQPQPENGHHKDFLRASMNGSRSPAQSTTTGESIKNEGSQDSHQNGERGGLYRLTKRRSRLRLAFWKRRPHHQHEVHGET
jgi:3',5'-cyclic-nucleotide phosphodiesterase